MKIKWEDGNVTNESVDSLEFINDPANLVYVYWDEGPLKDRDTAGGYYFSDLKRHEEPKEINAEGNPPPPDTSIVPPHNPGPGHVCPDCKDWHTKHADLRSNYDALLKDLKDERQEAYDKSDHVWVTRLDQKIQDMEKAISEKFPSEKQSAQLEHHDPIGHGMGDLYILPNSPEEAQKIIKFVEDCGRAATWSTANVEGHKWYGKRFIEVPFGMDIEKDMREHFANTPLHTRPVEEIMSSKQANFDGKCDMCKGPVCERCNQCHKCVQINGSMKKECGAQNDSEGLVVLDHTPARANTSADEIGKDTHDEFQDEWAEPARDIESAKSIPGSLFNAETAPAVVEQLKSGIKAPYVNAQVAALGGPENVSVIFTVSADPKESWSNGILENSRYGKFYLHNDGEVEQFSGGFAGWKQPNRAVRSRNVKSVDQLIQVINNHIAQVQATPKAASLKNPHACDAGLGLLKNAIKINVFNKIWEAIPVTNKEGKLSYEISDGKNKILAISPLNGKEMNAEHLKWAAERELTSNYKKATLIEKVAFLPEGTKGYVLAQDKAKKRIKIAFLEQNVRAWIPEAKVKIGALEPQEVKHGDHFDYILGQTAKETLLDCGEGNPMWVNSAGLLDANRPPATPESLNEIESAKVEKPSYKCPICEKSTYFKSAEGYRPFCSEECAKKGTGTREASEKGRKPSSLVHKEKVDELKQKDEESSWPLCSVKGCNNKADSVSNGKRYCYTHSWGKKDLKEAAQDCPDCHGTFTGKENEKCPTCGRFSVKEALKTALPPVLPNQRGYLDNPPPVEKKADGEVLSAEGLDMYANNTSELYPAKLQIIDQIKEMLANNSYDRNKELVREMWYNWFVDAARRYVKEFPEDAQPTNDTISDAAFEIEPYEKEKVERGEYDKEPSSKFDINKLPTVNMEEEKDKIIDLLNKEQDPEKRQKLQQRYKHLSMGSLKSASGECSAGHITWGPNGYQCLNCGAEGEHSWDIKHDPKKNPQLKASLNKVAIIVEENGKWCVRSPKNKNWNGGCYKSRAAAEKRLAEVERIKHMKGASLRPFSKKEAAATQVTDDTTVTTTTSPASPASPATPAVTTDSPSTTSDDASPSCALCGGMVFADYAQYQQHMEYTHASDTMPTSPSQKNLPTIAASKKTAAEVMTDPYASLMTHVENMKSRMAEVSERLQNVPLPKQADAEIIKDEQTPAQILEDIEMAIALVETKLGGEDIDPELHDSIESLENELFSLETKLGITKDLPTEEAKEPEHEEVIKERDEVKKEAQTVADETAVTTPVIQNVQPTDDDNLDIPTQMPTAPTPPGTHWQWDAANGKFVVMTDPGQPGKNI
jgi:endogenous inhibitor of DNA gyrase (YacG/DUF329 family)